MFEITEMKRGFKNTSYLVTSNIGIQIISFFAAIYIARKLGPENYGIFNTVTAFVAMFAFITLAGLNNTLVREGSRHIEKHSENLKKVISFQIWISFLAIIITIIASFLASYSNNIKIFIAFFSGTLLINALKSSLESVYQITERMQYISIINLINYGLYALLAVVFLYLGYGVFSLIVISVATNVISLILSYRISKKIIFFKLSFYPEIERALLKSGIIFSLITFFGFLYSKVDIVMASIFLTSKDVGLYSIAFRLVNIGEMVWNMVSLSFFPIVVKKFKKGPIPAKSLFKFSFLIFVIAFPVCLMISIFSNQIILILFGEQYLGADRILQIMIWVIAIGSPTLPFVLSMKANYLERYQLLFVIPRSAMNVGLNFLFIPIWGIFGIAYSTVLTRIIFTLIFNFGFQLYLLKKKGVIIFKNDIALAGES